MSPATGAGKAPATTARAYGLGIAGAVLTLLVAAWLMVARFALDFASRADGWDTATTVEFYTGVGLAAVAALVLLVLAVALIRRTRNDAPGHPPEAETADLAARLAALSREFETHLERCSTGSEVTEPMSQVTSRPASNGDTSAAVAQEPVTVRGTVSDGGAFLPEALVTLIDREGDVVAVATTGADGTYRLSGAHSGVHTLTAAAEHHQPAAVTLELTPGAELDRDLELSVHYRLSGIVSAAGTGTPVPDALVSLADQDGGTVDTTVTGPDGRYAFDHLAEGSYTLTATGHAPHTEQVRVPDAARSEDANSVTVDVALAAARSDVEQSR